MIKSPFEQYLEEIHEDNSREFRCPRYHRIVSMNVCDLCANQDRCDKYATLNEDYAYKK